MTLNKYLLLDKPPIRDTNCILDDYIPLISKGLIPRGSASK